MSLEYREKEVRVPERLHFLAKTSGVSVPAGGTVYLPDSSGIDVSRYKYKTITVKCDATLFARIEVRDDEGEDWDIYYPTPPSTWETVYSGRIATYSFEDDYKYARLAVYNSGATNQTVTKFVFKGRRL